MSANKSESIMDTSYQPTKNGSGSKLTAIATESKYKLKRIFARRIRIFRAFYVPVWLIVVIITCSLYYQKDQWLGGNTVSTSGISPADYSSKSFKDKFDLKYSSGDKRKVSSRWIGSKIDEPFQIGCVEPEISKVKKKANAALVVLARNKELKGVIKSMSTLERRFNQWFNYPWIFLNDEEFSEKFKATVKKYTKSEVEFGVIDKKMWDFPLSKDDPEEGEDTEKNNKFFNYFEFYEFIERQGDRGIMYGNLDTYHKMCRFYSGGFYKHPLVAKHEWYWRVEPDVEFYCDLTYDPFLEMEAKGKKYGFTVIIKEISETIPNLFRYTQSFIKEYDVKVKDAWNLFVNPVNTFDFSDLDDENLRSELANIQEADDLILALEDNAQINYWLNLAKKERLSTDKKLDNRVLRKLALKTARVKIPQVSDDSFSGEQYNFCHFWSNFEIARVDVWNNELYNAYFDYLEQAGGFYKERWGDAPVHSLAIGMFLSLSEIHYFRDIGYKHSTIAHCPSNAFDNQIGYSPSETYYKFGDTKRIQKQDYKWLNPDYPKKNGVGCRCKCPKRQAEIENTGGSCIPEWIRTTKDAEARKFNNKDRKYQRKLKVKKLKDLIATDYIIFVKQGGHKSQPKYVSSALEAYKAIKIEEEEGNIVYASDEFDTKLLEETERLVKQKKLELQENDLLKGLVG